MIQCIFKRSVLQAEVRIPRSPVFYNVQKGHVYGNNMNIKWQLSLTYVLLWCPQRPSCVFSDFWPLNLHFTMSPGNSNSIIAHLFFVCMLLLDWAQIVLHLTSCLALWRLYYLVYRTNPMPPLQIQSCSQTDPFPSGVPHMVVLTEKEKQQGSSDLVVNKVSSKLGHSEVELTSEWKCTTGRRWCRSNPWLKIDIESPPPRGAWLSPGVSVERGLSWWGDKGGERGQETSKKKEQVNQREIRDTISKCSLWASPSLLGVLPDALQTEGTGLLGSLAVEQEKQRVWASVNVRLGMGEAEKAFWRHGVVVI